MILPRRPSVQVGASGSELGIPVAGLQKVGFDFTYQVFELSKKLRMLCVDFGGTLYII